MIRYGCRLSLFCCGFLLLLASNSFSSEFIYPVGPPIRKPTTTSPIPFEFQIINGFAVGNPKHVGVDLANGREGDVVRAVATGFVVDIQEEDRGLGHMVRIQHNLPDGTTVFSQYAHLQEGSIGVNLGAPVRLGQTIGQVDCTGLTVSTQDPPIICESNGGEGPHLHFEIKRIDKKGCGYVPSAVDPCKNDPQEIIDNYENPLEFIEAHLASGADITAAATDVPRSIPDGAGEIASSLNFPTSGVILDMTLSFQFTHPCERDLVMDLFSPDGTVVRVMDRGNQTCTGAPQTFVSNTTLLPIFFGGEEASGTWRLVAKDDSPGFAGTLDSWSLEITVLSPTPPPPPVATFSITDPMGDHTGSIDVTHMSFSFSNTTGDYEITLTADAANPFFGDFRININLFNPDTGTTAQDPSFFTDNFNDFSLSTPTTTITLTGTNSRLLAWDAGDHVFTNSLAGTGNPDGIPLFRSSVSNFPLEFLTNEDVIAFDDLGQSAIIVPSPHLTTIHIDGDPSDWAGISPLVTDPVGNVPAPEEDFINLFVTNDSRHVYFLVEFADNVRTTEPFISKALMFLDADLNVNTGCLIFGSSPTENVGAEFLVTFNIKFGSTTDSALGDVRDCATSIFDFPGALVTALSGRFIEASVSIATLQSLTPGMTAFDLLLVTEVPTTARYTLQ